MNNYQLSLFLQYAQKLDYIVLPSDLSKTLVKN